MNIQKKHSLHSSLQKNQRGAASILMAVVILFAITLISVFTARTTIMEQKISGNEFRGRQAFEAAEAGLQAGISYFNNGGIDHNSDGNTDIFPSAVNIDGTTFVAGQPSYHIAFCDATLPVVFTPIYVACQNDLTTGNSISSCAPPSDPTLVTVFSCGWSDDQTAVKTVSQMVRIKPVLRNIPTSPLIVRVSASFGVGFNFTVKNEHTNTTIWAGGDPTLFGSFDTYIDADGSGALDTDPSSTATSLGPDVIGNDINLATATDAEFFYNFFGDTWTNVTAEADLTSLPSTNPESLGKLIYISGNATLTSSPNLGSPDKPVILIVGGTLTLASNVIINGLVYATNVAGGGGSIINGALVVVNVSTTDTVDVIYNPTTLSNTQTIGAEGAVSGSWHDWL